MFLYHLSLIGLLLLCCVVQQFLPPLGAYDARVLLLPLVVACGAVTVSTGGMLLIAFLGGFLWDAQQIIDPTGLTGEHAAIYNEIYHTPTETMKFGYSILLYALMGFLMQGIQPLFKQGKWYLSGIITGVAIFLYLSIEFLLFSFIRGGFEITTPVMKQISLTALLSMLASPLIFWALFQLAQICKHEISYDSLRRRNY
ncbi:hypothetical protein N9051_02180 [Akkermansiaceae bacterium]|nr:hypothetical protein [Akkermansiaceae bacterium]